MDVRMIAVLLITQVLERRLVVVTYSFNEKHSRYKHKYAIVLRRG